MLSIKVPQWLYETVMGETPSDRKGEASPVEYVGWYDAVAFCNKLSELAGLKPCYSLKGSTVVEKWGAQGTSWDVISCNAKANGFRLPTVEEVKHAIENHSDELLSLIDNSCFVQTVRRKFLQRRWYLWQELKNRWLLLD